MHPERFVVFIAVSLALFVSLLLWVLRHRPVRPGYTPLIAVSFVVVVVGMLFAKSGANLGLPATIYYGVPAAVTVALPPAAFRMRLTESLQYIVLAFFSAPVIHLVFSFFFGWHEYLPFWHVPSAIEMLHSGA